MIWLDVSQTGSTIQKESRQGQNRQLLKTKNAHKKRRETILFDGISVFLGSEYIKKPEQSLFIITIIIIFLCLHNTDSAGFGTKATNVPN